MHNETFNHKKSNEIMKGAFCLKHVFFLGSNSQIVFGLVMQNTESLPPPIADTFAYP